MIVPGSPEHRQRVIRNFRRVRANMQQLFVDVEHWNRTHPHETPIDADPDGQMRRFITSIDYMLECERVAKGVGPIEPVLTGKDKRTRQ